LPSSLKIGALDPDVVIIETMRRVLKGSENSAEDVAPMWRVLDVLAKAGKTVILSHHMRHPRLDGNDSARNRRVAQRTS
jgi:RecA-family ATPase